MRRRGIAEPAELDGARIGLPEWAQRAAIYSRALVTHEWSIPLQKVEWYQADVNDPGRAEKVRIHLPDGVRLRRIARSTRCSLRQRRLSVRRVGQSIGRAADPRHLADQDGQMCDPLKMELPERLGEVVPPADRAAPAYPIGSVDNTLRILLLLRDGRRLAISGVAAELGIARSSAHRLMAMLSSYDFVRQDPSDRSYGVGPALVDIGLSAARALDLRALARPVLERLVGETGLTAHLVLPRGRHVLFAEGLESRAAIRAALRTGTTLPAHVTGAGKAILATLTDDELRNLYRDAAPAAVTGRALSSVDALVREARLVRQRGYAVNRGESETGVLAMGIAIVTTDPDVLAGLSLSGPDSAGTEDWEDRSATALKRAAADLAKAIKAFLG